MSGHTPWKAIGGGKSVGVYTEFNEDEPISQPLHIASFWVGENVDGHANAASVVLAHNSQITQSVYESAVKGRQDFRQAFRKTAAECDRLRAVNADLREEIRRAQIIIDGLKLYRERIITMPLKATRALKERIRELATGVETDDFDRAIIMALDDLDRYIAAAKEAP